MHLIVVRFGSTHDRIYRLTARSIPATFRIFAAPRSWPSSPGTPTASVRRDQLAAAKTALRRAIGSGPKSKRVTEMKTRRLAVYPAVAVLVPLGLVIWRRNLVDL